jgi:hypothetical protein
MLTRIALLLLTTISAIPARAESTACDHAALARAEAGLLSAQAQYTAARDWGSQNRAVALVAAAKEQLRTARALCGVVPVAVATTVDPFETDEMDPDEAAWLAVCGDATADECGGLEVRR